MKRQNDWKEYTDYLKAEISKGIDEVDAKIFSSMSLEDLKVEARRRLIKQKD